MKHRWFSYLVFIFIGLQFSACQKGTPETPVTTPNPEKLTAEDVTSLYAQSSCSDRQKKGFYVLSNNSNNQLLIKTDLALTNTVFHIYLMKDGVYSIRVINYILDEANLRRVRINFQTWIGGSWVQKNKAELSSESILFSIDLKDFGTLSVVNEKTSTGSVLKRNQLILANDVRGIPLKGKITYLSRTFISKGPQNQSMDDICE